MYIPLTFFSTQGSCITYTSASIGGDGFISTGSFVSGGYYWDYVKFETTDYTNTSYNAYTASFGIVSGSTAQAKILIVAGGGTGGGRQQTYNDGTLYTNDYTGGGGAGGVVYYDNFPLTSGSYEIGVANAIAGTSIITGSNGKDSYIKLPDNKLYTPFTSSFITAYGGGFGGTLGYNSFSGNYKSLGPGSGGSAGGAGSAINGAAQAEDGLPNPNGGLNQPQGYRGGDAAGVSPSTGGGGAGGAGENSVVPTRYLTRGGIGSIYNLDGTPIYYAGGGGGATQQAGSGSYGQGGNPATTVGGSSTKANGGIVIIAWPRCASAFECKNFSVTASPGTLSYYDCNFSWVTQSFSAGAYYNFTACLTTFSGSNTPVVLTGAETASVIGTCSSAFTSSTDCHCDSILAVPNSGTQTLTYFPCNGSGSVTASVPPTGKYFCKERYSSYSFPNGGVTEFGICSTGSCEGIQYTSSVVNCSSVLATAGSGGGTLSWLPCGSGSAVQIELSGSESRSICAAYTSSFLGLTGGGSTLQTLGTCSYSPALPIVSWSFTENNQNGTFIVYSGASTVATLTANGSGSATITGSQFITASLAPQNFPSSGSVTMSLNVNDGTTISVTSSLNTTITASFYVSQSATYRITGSIQWNPAPTTGAKTIVFLAGNEGGTATYTLSGQTTSTSTTLSSGSSIQVCAYTNSISLSGINSKIFTGVDCGPAITASCDCYSASFTGGAVESPYAIQYIPCSGSAFTYTLLNYPETFSACISYPSSSIATSGQLGNPTSSLSISGSCIGGNCP
jgi:hypothetical protein